MREHEPARLDLDPELEREPLSTLAVTPSPAAKPTPRAEREDDDDEAEDDPPW